MIYKLVYESPTALGSADALETLKDITLKVSPLLRVSVLWPFVKTTQRSLHWLTNWNMSHQIFPESGHICSQHLRNTCSGFWRLFFRKNTGFGVAQTYQGRSSVFSRWRAFRVINHQRSTRKCENKFIDALVMSFVKCIADRECVPPISTVNWDFYCDVLGRLGD